jgi:hypothetical protein
MWTATRDLDVPCFVRRLGYNLDLVSMIPPLSHIKLCVAQQIAYVTV